MEYVYKTCTKCKELKSETEFHKNCNNHSKLTSHCKICRNLTLREKAKSNKTLVADLTNISKVCTCCNQYKPSSDFSRNYSTTLGLASQCKSCINNKQTEAARMLESSKEYKIPLNKICTVCSCNKPITDFGKESRRPDGHKSTCKQCMNIKLCEKRKLKLSQDIDNINTEVIKLGLGLNLSNIPHNLYIIQCTDNLGNSFIKPGISYRGVKYRYSGYERFFKYSILYNFVFNSYDDARSVERNILKLTSQYTLNNIGKFPGYTEARSLDSVYIIENFIYKNKLLNYHSLLSP